MAMDQPSTSSTGITQTGRAYPSIGGGRSPKGGLPSKQSARQSAIRERAQPVFQRMQYDGMLGAESIPSYLEELGLGGIEYKDLLQSLCGTEGGDLTEDQA